MRSAADLDIARNINLNLSGMLAASNPPRAKLEPQMNRKGAAGSPQRVLPKLNEWQCWEFMIQANSAPDKADGRQAMWLDGKLVGEFAGIRWREDPDLKVNCFWLQHYGYDESDPTKQYWGESQSVWFDDVVIAREYIGPRTER